MSHHITTGKVIPVRTGFGYDVHRLVKDRKLILGGVEIEFHLGLEGHSDADVLTHAICDAVLGAAGLGDIGRHFPDSDPAYKGASSIRLLETVMDKISLISYKTGNIDATLVAQSPKIAPFILQMRKNIAEACKTAPEQINIKATTTERLGFAGAGQGMAAYAVASIFHNDSF